MRERPILFSSSMARAILDGKKTQTRRIIKPSLGSSILGNTPGRPKIDWQQAVDIRPFLNDGGRSPRWWTAHACRYSSPPAGIISHFLCPYGNPGDRLWVRETWANRAVTVDTHGFTGAQIVYRADEPKGAEVNGDPLRWHPSIHMRREDSRLTLEITGIRVERLNEISEDDAQAEGVEPVWMVAGEHPEPSGQWTEDHAANYGEAYARLWDKINGPGAWEQNPWVWCISFRRVETSE